MRNPYLSLKFQFDFKQAIQDGVNTNVMASTRKSERIRDKIFADLDIKI